MTGYKELILRAEALRGHAGLIAYDRAVLLRDIAADPDFECEQGGKLAAVKFLDDLVQDLVISHVRLGELLRFYPDRDQWATGKLESVEMVNAMYAAQEQQDKEAAPKTKRKTATMADLQAAVERAAAAEAKAENLDEKHKDLQKFSRDLRKENEELRNKVAEQAKRIKELESLLANQAITV